LTGGVFDLASAAVEAPRTALAGVGPSTLAVGGRGVSNGRGGGIKGGVKDCEERGDGSPVVASAELTGGSATTEIGPA
jgi:hypothetical protein